MNVYEQEPETEKVDLFQGNDQTEKADCSQVFAKSGQFVMSIKGYCPPSPRISSIFLCKLDADLTENSIHHVNGDWYAQDERDPLMLTFFTNGKISIPFISKTDVAVRVADSDTVFISEEILYELLCTLNTCEEALTPYEMGEEAENDDEDEQNLCRPSRKSSRPKTLHGYKH